MNKPYSWPFKAQTPEFSKVVNMPVLDFKNSPVGKLGQMRQAIRMHVVAAAGDTPIDTLYSQISLLSETQAYIADAPDQVEMLRNIRAAFVDAIRLYVDAP